MVVNRDMLMWPTPHPKLGEALSAQDIARVFKLNAGTVRVWITRENAETPWPEEDGFAIPVLAKRVQPVAFWWRKTIEAHLQERGAL